MNRSRIYYLAGAILTIITGLLLRKLSWVPLWIGDSLYAIMIYLWVRTFFVKRSSRFALIATLSWCYTVEFLQLVQTPAMLTLRHTLFGRLVLGQGFLWSDLPAYTAGAVLIFVSDKWSASVCRK